MWEMILERECKGFGDIETRTILVSHFHSIGRISNEDYKKYMISENGRFLPKLID